MGDRKMTTFYLNGEYHSWVWDTDENVWACNCGETLAYDALPYWQRTAQQPLHTPASSAHA